MNMKRNITLYISIIISISALAQDIVEYGTGLVRDNEAYEKIPIKPTLLTRDYESLPESYSLRKYCPKTGSQGVYGTCSAWSTTYAARTIAEAIKRGWTDQTTITEEAFAPLFVYAQNKGKRDSTCILGIRINEALGTLKTIGAPKKKHFNVQCANYTPKLIVDEAKDFKIEDYFTLFNYLCKSREEKINKVKKAISQERAVIICMNMPRSFRHALDVWNVNDPNEPTIEYHAMCVVGYDNQKEGGAFLIMNSWSERWGNGGYTWVKYDDFARYVDHAFEMYVPKTNAPDFLPNDSNDVEEKKDTITIPVIEYRRGLEKKLAGGMYLQLSTGEIIPMTLLSSKGQRPLYRAKSRYTSGTRFRIYFSNDEPAYVYMIGSDQGNHVSKLFPHKDNISPALVYSSNNMALPDEYHWIQLGDNGGKDYLCLLYSARELPFNDILNNIRNGQGDFMTKLTKALELYDLVSENDCKYEKNEAKFKAVTKGMVVPLVIEMAHK